MAKKFVRGITDVKTINNQDFDTNNVNDLLSDGQYNYIHRKKGKNEEYHNLTDNIKTLSSDNTELLSVTNNNKTTNTATLHPKHDKQKEQVLESTRNTITIHHGENGTAEKTTVDTNPQKVLEHENLISDSEYITLDHQTDVNKTHIKTESLKQELQQLHQTKQDVLFAGNGISISGHTISATGSIGEGGSLSFQQFVSQETGLNVVKYTIVSASDVMTQYTFNCPPGINEFVITGALKEALAPIIIGYIPFPTEPVPSGAILSGGISSGAITITISTPFNEGNFDINATTMKLINSNYAAENVYQQETFTFYINQTTGS